MYRVILMNKFNQTNYLKSVSSTNLQEPQIQTAIRQPESEIPGDPAQRPLTISQTSDP